jgi:hypothetical protein
MIGKYIRNTSLKPKYPTISPKFIELIKKTDNSISQARPPTHNGLPIFTHSQMAAQHHYMQQMQNRQIKEYQKRLIMQQQSNIVARNNLSKLNNLRRRDNRIQKLPMPIISEEQDSVNNQSFTK